MRRETRTEERQPAKLALPDFAPPLLAWYDQNRRILPWREKPTPYRVWISEIMLQQTRVEAVRPYFERFLNTLPDLVSLAAADPELLLKLWEGLGYYSRVRNLQKAAQQVVAGGATDLPADYDALLRLPGVGSYTAGAVASIAFGIPVPAVDGNVLRVASRLAASADNISLPATKKAVEAAIAARQPADRPGDYNQALMELGATVCIPGGAPHCLVCPVRTLCAGYAQGVAGDLPVKDAKKPRRVERKTVFLLCCGDRIAVQKRPPTGLLASLWEYPTADGILTARQADACVTDWGLQVVGIRRLRMAKHLFTHVEWDMLGYWVEVARPEAAFAWVEYRHLVADYAVPSAYAAYSEALCAGRSAREGEGD